MKIGTHSIFDGMQVLEHLYLQNLVEKVTGIEIEFGPNDCTELVRRLERRSLCQTVKNPKRLR